MKDLIKNGNILHPTIPYHLSRKLRERVGKGLVGSGRLEELPVPRPVHDVDVVVMGADDAEFCLSRFFMYIS